MECHSKCHCIFVFLEKTVMSAPMCWVWEGCVFGGPPVCGTAPTDRWKGRSVPARRSPCNTWSAPSQSPSSWLSPQLPLESSWEHFSSPRPQPPTKRASPISPWPSYPALLLKLSGSHLCLSVSSTVEPAVPLAECANSVLSNPITMETRSCVSLPPLPRILAVARCGWLPTPLLQRCNWAKFLC